MISKIKHKMFKRFNSNLRFLLAVGMCTIFLGGVLIGLNIYIDVYGLFRNASGRKIQVYHAERISKYLLTLNYIPENFNTVILGSSLSDNIDFTSFNEHSDNLRIYNASIMGANISELEPLAENLLKHGVKNYVICLSPYLTKNSGVKEVSLDQKLYYGALGSKNLYETYVVGLIRNFNLMPGKFPQNQINESGVNNYGNMFASSDVRGRINKEVLENNDPIHIDSNALKSLQNLCLLLKKSNARVLFYYHPVPFDVFTAREKQFVFFQKTMDEILGDDFEILALNNRSFSKFSKIDSNYIDHAHLSKKGQSLIADTLLSHITKW